MLVELKPSNSINMSESSFLEMFES